MYFKCLRTFVSSEIRKWQQTRFVDFSSLKAGSNSSHLVSTTIGDWPNSELKRTSCAPNTRQHLNTEQQQ